MYPDGFPVLFFLLLKLADVRVEEKIGRIFNTSFFRAIPKIYRLVTETIHPLRSTFSVDCGANDPRYFCAFYRSCLRVKNERRAGMLDERELREGKSEVIEKNYVK